VAEGWPWGGAITAGGYQSPLGFFHYLVDQGLPGTNPVAAAAGRESASDTVAAAQATSWGWIALALAGLVALSLAALRLRRRILAVSRGNRGGPDHVERTAVRKTVRGSLDARPDRYH
jgi:hypothetical protein